VTVRGLNRVFLTPPCRDGSDTTIRGAEKRRALCGTAGPRFCTSGAKVEPHLARSRQVYEYAQRFYSDVQSG